ncbi:16S rRNA (guanine(527)-N(7))-methyltransferase RsmG [Sandaracinobacteroides saxicola]|uniref:Ribosomal RNA small subunit methyltransferase G n=1 Tax=Sandaracinobacteroides saxicola TaxID=2759707 RepID=A0A7G5IH80_9SPHN|nr:16S rRNA (guanine(527)-N(7))-methyltransferase RsmG [Sandaracinobacteroides saxicola]QMW22722.1 16S rRNA (guanine(527)-N(7))-methyltransferase RsmG [Sandaracinobacteroides saxicola]
MTPEAFADRFNVPRGTLDRLHRYAALLVEWQGRMNLVAPSTLPAIWHRHFADSAQLAALTPAGQHWVDMGAGGGFPSLVLAAMDHGSRFDLIESVGKKCDFLAAAVAEMGLTHVQVHCARVEALAPMRPDILTARACAPVERLFDWGLSHARPDTRWVLPKGVRHAAEISDAQRRYRFDVTLAPSMTEPEARILLATDVRRKTG